jgi:hypothetical protein
MKICVTGPWERDDDIRKMTGKIYKLVYQDLLARIRIRSRKPEKKVCIISGCAPWIDHTAISLFLDGHVLRYEGYSPSKIGLSNKFEYVGCGDNESLIDLLNLRYEEFSQCMNRNMMDDYRTIVTMVPMLGTVSWCSGGFQDRIRMMSSADYLICYTWDKEPEPVEPTCAAIWNKSQAKNKVHVPLSILEEGIVTKMPKGKVSKKRKKCKTCGKKRVKKEK